MADGQIALIGLHAVGGVDLLPQLPEELDKPTFQHLGSGEIPQLQLLPVPFVDFVVAVQNGFRRLNSEGTDGFAQGDSLGLVEIQNGVIQVQQ